MKRNQRIFRTSWKRPQVVTNRQNRYFEQLPSIQAEVEVNKFVKELQESKREIQILENRDMIVNLGLALLDPWLFRGEKNG